MNNFFRSFRGAIDGRYGDGMNDECTCETSRLSKLCICLTIYRTINISTSCCRDLLSLGHSPCRFLAACNACCCRFISFTYSLNPDTSQVSILAVDNLFKTVKNNHIAAFVQHIERCALLVLRILTMMSPLCNVGAWEAPHSSYVVFWPIHVKHSMIECGSDKRPPTSKAKWNHRPTYFLLVANKMPTALVSQRPYPVLPVRSSPDDPRRLPCTGCILWLPWKEEIDTCLLDGSNLHNGCFHQPVMISSVYSTYKKATILIVREPKSHST